MITTKEFQHKGEIFMRPRIDVMVFPEGKRKALTLSYDDGVIQDRKLVSILNKYGVKGTFNIGSGLLGDKNEAKVHGKTIDISKIEPEEVNTLYKGHEVAGHGLYHSSLAGIGSPSAVYEIIEDKRKLEELTGYCVRGFAYPFGWYNGKVIEMLKQAGYEYARVVETTGKFDIPSDFMEWRATAHHADARLMELAEEFINDEGFFKRTKLFYLWGHSYEFDFEDNWNVIEGFLDYVTQHRNKIWFATNVEICDYINAYRNLKYSVDGKMILNKSACTIWIDIYNQVYEIGAGETLNLSL